MYPIRYKQSVVNKTKYHPVHVIADEYGCSSRSIYRWINTMNINNHSSNTIIPVEGKCKRLFTGLDDNRLSELQLTDEALYSLSYHRDADKLSKIIKKKFGKHITITDGTSNVGGNVISFAKFFDSVNAVEIDPVNFQALRNNIEVYKFTNVNLYNLDFTKQILKIKQDVVFLDPPWGGIGYKKKLKLKLFLGDRNVKYWCKKIFNETKTKAIYLKVPNNFDFNDFDLKKKLHKFKKYTILYTHR